MTRSGTLRPSAGGQGLALLLRREQQLVLHYHAGYEPTVVQRLREVPLDHPYPAMDVARSGRPRYLSSLGEFVAAQARGGAGKGGQGEADEVHRGSLQVAIRTRRRCTGLGGGAWGTKGTPRCRGGLPHPRRKSWMMASTTAAIWLK